MDEVVDKLLRRYEEAKTIRSKYENTLTEIGKYVWPNMQDVVNLAKNDNGEMIRTVDVYDTTAQIASSRMASGIMGNMMPIGLKWFEFSARDTRLNDDFTIKQWCSQATEAVHKVLWESNFIGQMSSTIRSLITFTLGAISVQRIGKRFSFNAYHIRDIFFDRDSNGDIDTEFRRIYYTARQAKQAYKGELGDSIKQALKDNSQTKFEFVHCIYPNDDYNEKIGSKKYASRIINVKDRVVVEEGGYTTLPYKIVKYGEMPDGDMGYSPAVEILPTIKMVNEMQKTLIKSAEMVCDPPLIVEDDGVVGQPVRSPGGTITIRSGAFEPKPLKTGSSPQLTREFINDVQQVIRESFLNDVFDSLKYYRKETAAELKQVEIAQRVEEGFVILAPLVATMQRDLLDPLMFDILDKLTEEELPKFPEKFDMKLVYQGRLSLAMSSMQTNAIETVLAKWAVYDEKYQVFDNINVDDSFKLSAINTGVPAKLFKDEKDVMALREARNAPIAAAQQAQIAAEASKAYKNVTTAPQDGSLGSML